MKNFKWICFAFAALVAMGGCSKSDKVDPEEEAVKSSIIGQWHLVSWSALQAADVYVSFTEEGSFELYQRVYAPAYTHFSGLYNYSDGELSGEYSDGTAWGGTYTVAFNTAGTEMTLTSIQSPEDVSVFEKTSIPEEILSGELEASPASRADVPASRFF